MKKVLAGLFVTMVAALTSMGFASTAQAYPCPEGTTANTPSTTTTETDTPVVGCHSVPPGETPPADTPPGDTPPGDTPPKSTEVTLPPKSTEVTATPAKASVKAAETGILPNTGGPEGVLLIGGVALLAVGGTAVIVARRRQTH